MRIIIIAAASENNVIGNKETLPWDTPGIPEDMTRFKHLTLGHPAIQGRKTYESIVKKLGKPLPGSQNIVVSRSLSTREGILVARTMDEALNMAKAERKNAYVIGGEEIYRMFMSIADVIELTRVHQNYDGDAFFPEIDFNKWRLDKGLALKSRTGIPFSFLTYERL